MCNPGKLCTGKVRAAVMVKANEGVSVFRRGQGGTQSLRYVAALLLTLVMAACNKTPFSRNNSQSARPPQVLPVHGQKPSTDSPMAFLLAKSANDFHDPRAPEV